jgi:hypothetical protein
MNDRAGLYVSEGFLMPTDNELVAEELLELMAEAARLDAQFQTMSRPHAHLWLDTDRQRQLTLPL